MWEWRRSRKLVFWDARDCAPGQKGRLNRPSSIIPRGVGRRRRPVDGLWISQTDSYERPDQAQRPTPGSAGTQVAWGTHQGMDQGSARGTDPGIRRRPNNSNGGAPTRLGVVKVITRAGDGPEAQIGLGAAGTLNGPRSSDALTLTWQQSLTQGI